jgi:ABC-type nickel/cobalt efflux system permease component RcnA
LKKKTTFTSMKIVNIILSIYIIVLAAYPCADKHIDGTTNASHSLAHSHVHSQTHEQHNHSPEDETDLCSPFCVCNCCGQQTLTFLEVHSFQFLVQFKEIKSSISFYKSIIFSNFYGSIWQPPQIV